MFKKFSIVPKMSLETSERGFYQILIKENISKPIKCTYIDNNGFEFTVVSEGIQTDESWMEYVDEYRMDISILYSA